MKSNSLILATVLTLGVMPAAFGQTTTTSSPDSSAQPTAAPTQQTPSQTNPSTDPSTPGATGATPTSEQRNFVGSIVKTSGKFVLHTGAMDYQLDNQGQAKKYEGKDVKVTGQLDASSNTIRVQAIDPSSSM